jgi:acetyl-CoA acetyltransferase
MKSGEYAIVGLCLVHGRPREAVSERRIRQEAIDGALRGTGLSRQDLDGCIAACDLPADLRHLGLSPSFSWMLQSSGASAVASVVAGIGAIETGQARHVLCLFSFCPNARGAGFGGRAYGYPMLFGMYGPAASHALHATRHMHRYGTTSEQLGAVAVVERAYAVERPGTVGFGEPLTLEDHQRSRMIAEPLRLYDCCRDDVDVGVAYVLTTSERAEDLPARPAFVAGVGHAHNIGNWHNGSVFDHHDDVGPAAEKAFGQADLTVADVDVAELYDAFTISVIMQLEAYGFCPEGEGGPFVASGGTGPGGAIPTNTGGGSLSGVYATGFTPLTEGFRQVTGTAETGQIPDADVVLVSGHGGNAGVQNTWAHGTLLLTSRRW